MALGIGQHFERLAMIGQPSSPGMWVANLRFARKLNRGRARFGIDMTVATAGSIGSLFGIQIDRCRRGRKACLSCPAEVAPSKTATNPRIVLIWLNNNHKGA